MSDSGKKRRVLLKLSGEAFGAGSLGVNPDVISSLAREIAEAAQTVEIAVVVGGGNIIRGLAASHRGIDRVTGDYMGMLELDLASRSIEDRAALHRQVFGDQAKDFAIESEVVRLVEDTDHDGVADKSSVYADGFNSELDGIASGVLARHGQVWFTNIPSLWLLEGEAGKVKKTELLRGFGVRCGIRGKASGG